jgi:DNA-binding transcriptional regulator YdaS (Cro superfamily)
MNTQSDQPSPIARAVQAAGGPSALARKLSTIQKKRITPQAVHGWVVRGRVPFARVLDVEALQGEVTRHELCPELFPQK